MALRSVCRGTVRQSLPSSRIAPALVSVNRSSAATRLLLPAPAVVQVRLGPDGHCCSKRRKGKERKERKGKERKGKERKGKERKGKERKGKERKGKERKGKERKGKGKERKGKDYAFWRQFQEKPSVTPGCPDSDGHCCCMALDVTSMHISYHASTKC